MERHRTVGSGSAVYSSSHPIEEDLDYFAARFGSTALLDRDPT
jgi:hypothetical protein